MYATRIFPGDYARKCHRKYHFPLLYFVGNTRIAADAARFRFDENATEKNVNPYDLSKLPDCYRVPTGTNANTIFFPSNSNANIHFDFCEIRICV